MTVLEVALLGHNFFYYAGAFALCGILVFAIRMKILISRGIPARQAVLFPVLTAVLSIILFSQLMFWNGVWVLRSAREYIAEYSWLSLLIEPFNLISIILALFPALITVSSVVSVSSLRSRIALGASAGLVSVLLLEIFSGYVDLRTIHKNPEIQFAILTTPFVGAMVGMFGTLVDYLLRPTPNGQRLRQAATIGTVLVSSLWLTRLLLHPLNQRVVVLVKDWERMMFASQAQLWGSSNRKITAKAKWVKFQLTDDGMSLYAGRALPPRWEPTRLEIRRIRLAESGERVRQLFPFSLLPGDVVYTNDNPIPFLRFNGPSRECVVIGDSVFANGVDVELTPPFQKSVVLTPVTQDQTPWPEKRQVKNYPRALAINLLDGKTDLTIKGQGRGVWSLFCYAAVRFDDSPTFRFDDFGTSAEKANAEFEPKRFRKALKFATHPAVVMSVGRANEEYEIKLSAKVTQVSFERESLRLGDWLGSPGIVVSRVDLQAPDGQLAIGRTLYDLTSTSELRLGGDKLIIRRTSSGEVRIDGSSSRIVLNDEVISRTFLDSLPQWLQEKLFSLVILIGTNAFTFYWASRRLRRGLGNNAP